METTLTNGKPGFSDSLLLTVSVAGFCVMAVMIHRIILSRFQNHSNSEHLTNETIENSEEWLIRHANVANLNRAQRRSRAKYIVKEQRRRAATAVVGTAAARMARNDEDQEVDQNDIDIVQQQQQPDNRHVAIHHDGVDGGKNMNAVPHATTTRKERQMQAKLAEREERRLYQQERYQQQQQIMDSLQEQKKERLVITATHLEKERQLNDLRQEKRRQAQILIQQTFLSTEQKSQSVQEFINETSKIVRLEQIASTFGVTIDVVKARLCVLQREGRITGFFTTTTIHEHKQERIFVVLSNDELQTIADSIRDKGIITLQGIATMIQHAVGNLQ